MFHQNLQRTGYLDTVGPLTNQTLWKFNTGGQIGSPAVSGDAVYVGGYDHNVYAFNTQTGAQIWNYTTDGIVVSRPAIADGLVYVGSEDNNMYALNAQTGSLVWKFTTGYYVDSDPAVQNGVVYVGSEDRNVYALNAQTGEKIWNYTTGGQIMLSSPTLAEGLGLHWHVRPQNLRPKPNRRHPRVGLTRQATTSFQHQQSTMACCTLVHWTTMFTP